MALSTLAPFTFDPQLSRQELDVSVLLGRVAVTVGGPVGTSVEVNDSPVALAAPSAPVTLMLGQNTLNIDVTVGALSRRYALVFDRGAVQPLEYAFVKAGVRDTGDWLGWSIAAAGDFVMVGVPFEDSTQDNDRNDNSTDDSGAVLVFRRTGTELMFMKGGVGVRWQGVGFTVAMDEEWFVAGGPNEAGTAPGVVYLWRRSGMTWATGQQLTAPTTSNGDLFGYAVDIHGDTLAVASPWGSSGGSVYIYRRNTAGAWVYEATLHPPSSVNYNTGFGCAVSLGHDLIAVGAPVERSASTGVSMTAATDQGTISSGAVYVFRRSGTTWTLESYIKASNTGSDDRFGSAIDLDGDTLAVAATGESSGGGAGQDDNSVSLAGAVYVFRRSGVSWSQEAFLKSPVPSRNDMFGTSMSLRVDTLAIGAPDFLDSNGPGSVHVFNRVETTWGPVARLTASNADPGDRFHTVTLGPDGLYVGAPCESSQTTAADNSSHCSGAAYFFR